MRSLVAKFTVLCGIILISAIAMLVVIQYQSTVQDNHRSSQVHASLITELFATGISSHLASNNRAGLNDRLREFAAREDVGAVYVVDAMREVVAAAGPARTRQNIPPTALSDRQST